jgi:uncharacterized Fe-S cluster-containing radical SAM superfamily protein
MEIEPENNTFSTLVADITHRCNMKCANCYIPNRNIPDMDINKLYELLTKLPNKTYIRLIGAEPTMRNDLPDIIYNVKKLGHRVSICTNGLKLNNEYCKQLKQAGLNIIHLSMNGADDDNLYKLMDNGKYAKLKLKALENIFNNNMLVTVSAIIAKNVNEQVIPALVKVLIETANKCGVDFRKRPWNVNQSISTIRFRSVGAIGNYISDSNYSLDELYSLVTSKLDVYNPLRTACGTGYNNYNIKDKYSWTMQYHSIVGEFLIRLTSWETDEDGVIDSGNEYRGRITQNWKISPFFEHVKENEFGY